jgi:hypothetical protein
LSTVSESDGGFYHVPSGIVTCDVEAAEATLRSGGGRTQASMEDSMRRAAVTTVLVGLSFTATQVAAQFWDKMTNPKISVTIRHPPGLGMQVSKVAFGEVKGDAAQQFTDALTEQFVRANVEVVERQKLDSILAEHNFSLSGYVDSASAAEMGKILGPSVLLFVSIPRLHAEQKPLHSDWKDNKGFVHRTHISRTQVFARGSVRAVDLATGRIFAAKTLTAQPSRENKVEDQCCAEFPPEDEVVDAALNDLVGQAQRLFLPWQEQTDLYFFDDKDCNLKTAHAFMKAGNVDAALQQSLTNVEACKALPKVKDKNLFHANYNVGMGYFASGQFDKALEYLNAAQLAKTADITTESIGECMRAKALATEMQRVEERVALDATVGASRRAEAPAAAAPAPPPAARGARPAPPKVVGGRPAPPPPASAAPAAASDRAGASVEERLQKLDALLKKGLITKADYDAKKAELLKEL